MKSTLTLLAALLLAPLAALRAADAPFTANDPLGLNVDDIPPLNAMPEQTLLRTGFIDVTKPPFNADSTGVEGRSKGSGLFVVIFGHRSGSLTATRTHGGFQTESAHD